VLLNPLLRKATKRYKPFWKKPREFNNLTQQKMSIDTKKIIAKEIIYLFSAIILVLIFWSIIEIRNTYTEKKIENISKQILILQFQINRNKQKKEFILSPDKEKLLLKNLTELAEKNASDNDMRTYMIDFENKFSSEKIKFNQKTKIIKNKKNDLIQKQNIFKKKYLNQNEKKTNLLIFSIVLFSLLYPIRIIIILLKWSFKILK
jgi:hypothetical protein